MEVLVIKVNVQWYLVSSCDALFIMRTGMHVQMKFDIISNTGHLTTDQI